MDVTERFAQVAGPSGTAPLDVLALLVAAHADHRVDVDARVAQLDALAASVCEPTLDGVRALLFDDLGFTGNTADYYDPDNSFLDKVLDRRVGIPISLSVLLIEVARRVGVELHGVGAPGHFLVRCARQPDCFVDAFRGGVILTTEQACEVVGHRRAAHNLDPLPEVDNRAIALRMLTNLKAVYSQRGDAVGLAWVLRLRLLLPGVDRATEQAELDRVLTHFN